MLAITSCTSNISFASLITKSLSSEVIAITSEERDLVISEAKEILDVQDVIASIILLEDLRIQRE